MRKTQGDGHVEGNIRLPIHRYRRCNAKVWIIGLECRFDAERTRHRIKQLAIAQGLAEPVAPSPQEHAAAGDQPCGLVLASGS